MAWQSVKTHLPNPSTYCTIATNQQNSVIGNMAEQKIIPQPHSLWWLKANHNLVYEVDSCDRFTVYYKIRSDEKERQFRHDIKYWLDYYEELPIDDVTIETGGVY